MRMPKFPRSSNDQISRYFALSHGAPRYCALLIVAIVTLVLAACGNSSGLSGSYEADMGGGGIRVDFSGGNKAKVTLFGSGGQGELSHNAVYTMNGTTLHFTTDEPMGAPMDLVYENDVLSDGSGMIFKKQ